MNKSKAYAIFKLFILLVIIIGIPVYLILYQSQMIQQLSSFDNVKAVFQEHRGEIFSLYVIAQVLQIVVCFIPGQWLQITIGYLYNGFIGFLLSVAGAFIGSVITYYLASFLGHDAMHMFFGEEKIKNMVRRLNSKKGLMIIFMIYLIPGVPKDICNYAAGLSEMKMKAFLLVSIVGRSPAMLGSIVIGTQLRTGNYDNAIIIGFIAIILFILGIKYRNKLHQFFDAQYDKLIGE